MAIAAPYQLPQGCASGQVPKRDGSGNWGCGDDLVGGGGGGGVTSLSQGTGIVLSPNPITGSGSIAADTNYLQRRVNQFCAPGWSIQSINADGSVSCEFDDPGPAWGLAGNAGDQSGDAVPRHDRHQALEIRVNNARVMRFGAGDGYQAGNIAAGHPNNSATGAYGDVYGVVVGGGGTAGSECWEATTDTFTRSCANHATGSLATIGGGYANTAGPLATVAGGFNNVADGQSSAVIGGVFNSTGGYASTVAGGQANSAAANYSFAAGWNAKLRPEDFAAFVWNAAGGYPFSSVRPYEFAISANGGVRIASERGVALDAVNAPIITRGHDAFDSSAGSAKEGLGRWGLFMEPYRLNPGMPNLPGRSIGIGRYELNGTYYPLMYVDQAGDLFTVTGTIHSISDVAQKKAAKVDALERRLGELERKLRASPAH